MSENEKPIIETKEGTVDSESSENEENESRPNINPFVLNEEFLKLYFREFGTFCLIILGISENLHVERSKLHQGIFKAKNRSKFLFAICKVKKKDNGASNVDQSENVIKEFLNLYLPQETMNDTKKFLAAAYSGFSTSQKFDSEINPLFAPITEKNKNYHLKNRFNEIKEEQDKTNNKECVDKCKKNLIDYFFKNRDLIENHNYYIEKLFNPRNENKYSKIEENILDQIPQVNAQKDPDEKVSYNVFFAIGGHLYEIQPTENKITKKFLSSTSERDIREDIYKELLNKQKGFVYEEDLTVFELAEPEQLTDLTLKKDGIIVVFVITVLFIINFMITNPETIVSIIINL